MSSYRELLELARRQVATAQAGDVESAIGLLETRQQLLDEAPPASADDRSVIQEVLSLDKQLAGFIRERMLEIRHESQKLQRGQTAMRGYASFRPRAGDRLNSNC